MYVASRFESFDVRCWVHGGEQESTSGLRLVVCARKRREYYDFEFPFARRCSWLLLVIFFVLPT